MIKVIARKGKKGRKCRGPGNNIKFISLKYTKLVEMEFSAIDPQLNKRNYDFSLKWLYRFELSHKYQHTLWWVYT